MWILGVFNDLLAVDGIHRQNVVSLIYANPSSFPLANNKHTKKNIYMHAH